MTPPSAGKRPRWLLVNPPHKLRVVRDCYCSDIVKAGYYWHPMDLIVQAAMLAARPDVSLGAGPGGEGEAPGIPAVMLEPVRGKAITAIMGATTGDRPENWRPSHSPNAPSDRQYLDY